jgi:hypothetical protein
MRGHNIVRGLIFVLLSAFGVMMTSGYAEARGCRVAADPDNPMMTSESYGVALCRVHRERYRVRADRGHRPRRTGADDPMVWSDHQWRSDLFAGYSRTYDDRYDRRGRPEARHRLRTHVVAEVLIASAPQPVTSRAKPVRRGPKLLSTRQSGNPKAGPGVLRFSGNSCRGVLVLTWGTLGARERCHEAGGRVRTPSPAPGSAH